MDQVICTLPVKQFTQLIKRCIREELNCLTPSGNNGLLKIDDVVKLLGISKVTLHKWKRIGILPYHRIGSRVYFKQSELVEALKASPKNKNRILKQS